MRQRALSAASAHSSLADGDTLLITEAANDTPSPSEAAEVGAESRRRKKATAAIALMDAFRSGACLVSQQLVPPGVIYHITRQPPPDSESSQASAAVTTSASEAAAASEAAESVPSSDPFSGASFFVDAPAPAAGLVAKPQRFAVHAVLPAALARIRISASMVSDHDAKEILAATTAVLLAQARRQAAGQS